MDERRPTLLGYARPEKRRRPRFGGMSVGSGVVCIGMIMTIPVWNELASSVGFWEMYILTALLAWICGMTSGVLGVWGWRGRTWVSEVGILLALAAPVCLICMAVALLR